MGGREGSVLRAQGASERHPRALGAFVDDMCNRTTIRLKLEIRAQLPPPGHFPYTTHIHLVHLL